MKKIIVFDLDGTLAQSKSPLDKEMSTLLSNLLQKKAVAIVSGGGFTQFEKQVINRFSCPKNLLENLIIFPTKGGSMYKFEMGIWHKIYSESFSEIDKTKIVTAVDTVSHEENLLPKEHFGKRLEDREAEFTFSALGQEAPQIEKEKWDPDYTKRKILQNKLQKLLPEFDVAIGGSTSIDITSKHIDKAFAINQICTRLGYKKEEILFIGDAFFPGGNDASVKTTGIETIAVKNVEETKNFIRKIIDEDK
ncbi:MAG: HAD-IIB family hydrolase [Minisyncoccia bacterium]